jgi:glycogen operon protein
VPGHEVTLLIILNSHHEDVSFALPEGLGGRAWNQLLDTDKPAVAGLPYRFGDPYAVVARSVVLFELQTEPAGNSLPGKPDAPQKPPPARRSCDATPLHALWGRGAA